jgi:phosphoesterase RecJ-like protein
MDKNVVLEIIQKLLTAQNILLLAHVRPDGDAIGSLVGLGLSLKDLGKNIQMVIPEGFPGTFRYLAGVEHIHTKPHGQFDLIVTLDCSDLMRLKEVLNDYGIPDINIDHHPTNLNFAEINLIDVHAVATAEMVAQILIENHLPVTQDIANALLLGIITDTLGFRTHNLTPQAMRITADLMEAGGDLPKIYFHGLLGRSFPAARYWGKGLANLQQDGRMIWTSLTLSDRKVVGYPGKDDADLINVLTTIDGVDVVVVFVEQPNGQVKVSWRAQPGFDVSQVALHFGGGGHVAAAGAEIDGSIADVESNVLRVTREILEINHQ